MWLRRPMGLGFEIRTRGSRAGSEQIPSPSFSSKMKLPEPASTGPDSLLKVLIVGL